MTNHCAVSGCEVGDAEACVVEGFPVDEDQIKQVGGKQFKLLAPICKEHRVVFDMATDTAVQTVDRIALPEVVEQKGERDKGAPAAEGEEGSGYRLHAGQAGERVNIDDVDCTMVAILVPNSYLDLMRSIDPNRNLTSDFEYELYGALLGNLPPSVSDGLFSRYGSERLENASKALERLRKQG